MKPKDFSRPEQAEKTMAEVPWPKGRLLPSATILLRDGASPEQSKLLKQISSDVRSPSKPTSD